MNVLVQKGNKIGFNLVISEWVKSDLPKRSNLYQNGKSGFTETVKSDLPKQSNTKENITKNNITKNNPLPPSGESAVAEGGQAEQVESARAVAETSQAKTKPKAKSEPVDYEGVMATWNEVFADTPVSKLAVMNDVRKRKIHRLAKELRSQFGSYSPKAFGDYFRDFLAQAEAQENSWYLGGGDRKWVAGFDYLMRPEIFAKTVENAL